MTSPPILPLLKIMASLESSTKMRRQACNDFHEIMQGRIGWLLKEEKRSLSSEDVDDILQHLLMQASTGTARCKATSEGEAWNWCKTVVQHKAYDLFRRMAREVDLESAPEEATASPGNDTDTERVLDAVEQQIALMMKHIEQSARGSEKMASVICAVDYSLHGATIQEQLARHAPQATSSVDELRRARNRIYAYRSRGVSYLLIALRELEANRTLDPQETRMVRTILSKMKRE